jgi:GPH family glycoside/pentoside/hexuronide:cation symporter
MEKLRFKEKIAYGFGDMASSMFWKIFGMYLLFFYTKVFGISPAAAGTMFLLTRIWDAVNDPIMGLISDRTHSRWGKYRPYLLWGAIPFALIGIMTFFTPDWGSNAKLAYAYVTYTFMMMVYTLVNVPYASLLGVMSPDPKDRNTLSSYRMFFAYVGSFITFMILQPLVDLFSSNPAADDRISTEPGAWTAAVAVIGGICAVLFFLCFKWTRERVKAADEQKNKASVGKDLKMLFSNKPWWILLASGVAALLFNSIRDGVALFYFTDYVTSTFRTQAFGWTLGTVYLLVGQASNMIGVVLAAPAANRIGKKSTYIIAMVLGAVLSMLFFRLKTDQVLPIMVFQVLISTCAASYFLCSGVCMPILSTIRSSKRTQGYRPHSEFFFHVTEIRLGRGRRNCGWLLAAFGYNADIAMQSESAIYGVRLMMSYLPGVSCILAVIAISLPPGGEENAGSHGPAEQKEEST